jgi:hypothetical protein
MKPTNGIEIVTQQLISLPFLCPRVVPWEGRSWVGLKLCKPPSHKKGIYTCKLYMKAKDMNMPPNPPKESKELEPQIFKT